MDQEKFGELVSKAVDALPPEFLDMLENVDVVVEEYPTPDQIGKAHLEQGEQILLGLYEGVPLTQRTTGYTMVLPDKITLFQQAIESVCRTDDEIYLQIQKTVKHEIAHHFGISDARLNELEEKLDFSSESN